MPNASPRNMGFKIEDDLNTEKSRKLWLEWKRRSDKDHYPDPKERARLVVAQPGKCWLKVARSQSLLWHHQLQCGQCKGQIAGRHHNQRIGMENPRDGWATRLSWPGLYGMGRGRRRLDRTRRGEPVFRICSFLIVELMRNGKAPRRRHAA